jgi:hypothetical protein
MRENPLSGTCVEGDVITEPVRKGEFVTTVNSQPPHYFYTYTNLIDTFILWYPFTSFEISMLRVLNVAPSQLHPNSRAFIKAFQLACLGLEIEQPSIAVFFSFYHIKNLSPGAPVSLCSQPNRKLFHLFASNYKSYSDSFVRFRCGDGFPDLMFNAEGEPLFSFYWTTNPRVIKGVDHEKLDEFERETVAYLEMLCLMDIGDLLSAEGKSNILEDYLSKWIVSWVV